MRIVSTIEAMRAARKDLKGRVGVVLTMGALHAGHLALVRAARTENDRVIVSIFINPAQFMPGEDLAAYPRTLETDLDVLQSEGVDVVFTPSSAIMYPPGYETYIAVENVSQGLEGEARPGHFRGVATVVAKLFHLTQPNVSYFGQKDAQQVVVIRHMVRDLDFPLQIAVLPTSRDTDGLALSSRNAYLQPNERRAASVLWDALNAASIAYEAGERLPARLRTIAQDVIAAEPLSHPDYVAINDPSTLRAVHREMDAPVLISMAVQIGKPRLLDNMLLPRHFNDRAGLTTYLGA